MLKILLLSGLVVGSLILGFWPRGLTRPKPTWWRWLTIVSLFIFVTLAFGIPTGGTFSSGEMVAKVRGEAAVVPIRGTVTSVDEGAKSLMLRDRSGRENAVDVGGIESDEFKEGDDVILALGRGSGAYKAEYVVASEPWIALPLLPELEERARNLYFHVPTAWLAQVGWFVAFWFALRYLRRKNQIDDVIASSAAGVGAVFCILATVTGAVWAKFNWGMFWNWDPRQVSIFVVLIMYGSYFALRSAIDNDEQRARISSAYLVLLLLPVIFFIFVYPRLQPGLHPGAEGDATIGPVIDPDADAIELVKQLLFGLGFFSLTMLFFWGLNLSIRSRLVEHRWIQRANATEYDRKSGEAIAPTTVRLR